MEWWACGFLIPGSTNLQKLDVENVSKSCSGGWGFTLLQVEGAWELFGRMAGSFAGLQAATPQGLVSIPMSGKLQHMAAGWQRFTASSGQPEAYECSPGICQSIKLWESIAMPANIGVSALSAGEKHRIPLILAFETDDPFFSFKGLMADCLTLLGNGSIWAWGSNLNGRLCTFGQTSFKRTSSLQSDSLALLEDGSVWAWGSNMDGQLGTCGQAPSSNALVSELSEQPEEGTRAVQSCAARLSSGRPDPFRQVACGARHSCALTQAGSLYTWGFNLHHQCGVTCPSGVNVTVPALVLSLGGLKVTCVAAGLHHTIVCTDAGAVYTWGQNQDGQLGLGDYQGRAMPTLVEDTTLESHHVTKVCSGARHCAALTDGGTAFAWGWNKFCQLGMHKGDTKEDCTPCKVKIDGATVRDLSCGWWHTLFLVDRH